MRYEIKGGNLPVVIMELHRGETVFTESGGMGWMSGGFEMDTNMEGGLFGGIARKLSGESLFMTNYTCGEATGTIAFPSSFPGTIVPLTLQSGQSIICQKRSFLVGERSVKLEVYFKQRFSAGIFGGEGFILQRISGPGTVFVEIDGSVVDYELRAGEELKVDTGHVAMFEPTVQFEIERVKGITNIFFGGEGLFLTRLRGPGKVWLQTMPIPNLAGQLLPFLPIGKSD
ncbi:MAG: TIGR00266 family protein [Thermotaleaceae bacterium]